MTETFEDIRASVPGLGAAYPRGYWWQLDAAHRYPEAFVGELPRAGDLAALIPEEYGGSGPGLPAAAAILKEFERSGCDGGACQVQMDTMRLPEPASASLAHLAEHVPGFPRFH